MKTQVGMHKGNIVSTVNGVDVIECDLCGFKHVHPYPAAEKLKQFYEEEFYQAEKANYLKNSEKDIEWKQIEFAKRFSIAEGHVPSSSILRALDIGSGPGEFVALGKQKGWDVVGVEPSPVAARYATELGLNIINDFFGEDLLPQLGQFDFIHMSEVLEHIPNPREILDLAIQVLKPGGVLCVSVPNDYSAIQGALVSAGASEWWVVPDHHLNYFDFETLERLIQKVGLRLLERTTNFPMELFLLMGQDYTTDPELGRRLHSYRKNLDINLATHGPELMDNFYAALASAGMGRLAVVFAQKPVVKVE